MPGDGSTIVIEGSRGDWPGGARTLTPRESFLEHNGQTLWFGADLDPDGSQVWFRISSEAVRRMREQTPTARGDRLIDALLAWVTPDRPTGAAASYRYAPEGTVEAPSCRCPARWGRRWSAI